MISSHVYVDAQFDEAAYRVAFADAFGLRHGAVTCIRGGDDYPEQGSCDAFVEIWPMAGGYPVAAQFFVLTGEPGDAADQAAEEAEASGAAWQVLADSLGCGVCAPSQHLEPWRYLVYRPGTAPAHVEVDTDLLHDSDCLSMKPAVDYEW